MASQKKYLYKVYDRAGNYKGTWNDVVSDFSLSEAINEAGGEMQVTLGRSADNFGEGTDVDFGFQVKVYVEDTDAANGSLVFTGYISNYVPTMGGDESVAVTVLGYGAELNDIIIQTDLNNDQSQATGSTDQEFTDVMVAQSFIPTVAGLDAVDVKLRVDGVQNVTLSIYRDLGGVPDTAPLSGASVTKEITTTSFGIERFTFDSQVGLNAGQIYWIVISGPTAAGGTIDIEADSTMGNIYTYDPNFSSHNAAQSFAVIQAGTGSSSTGAAQGIVGQQLGAAFDSDFVNLYEVFCRFDTTVIPPSATITAATLKAYLYNSPSDTGANFDIEAFIRSWTPPLSNSAFVSGTDITALTRLAVLAGLNNATATGLKSFTSVGNNLINNINRGGYTNMALLPADFRNGLAPGGVQTATFEASISGSRPKLTISYTSNPRAYAACSTSNPYASGSMATYSGSTWTVVSGSDLYFVTYSSDNATTVPYLSEDPGAIMRDLIDKYRANGGTLNYDATTIELTGTTVSYTFNTNTTMEGVKKVLELAPPGWYFYVDQATNMLHFHNKSGSVERTFVLGRDILTISPKKTIENMINQVFFTGGGDPPLFLKFQNTTSIGLYGYKTLRYVDQRVTSAATAETIATAILEQHNAPELQLEFEVADNNGSNTGGSDLEAITLGDVMGIRNTGGTGSSLWDNAIWDIAYWDYNIKDLATALLQIVRLERGPESAKIFCSTVPPDVNKRIEDINRNLEASQTANNPTSPS